MFYGCSFLSITLPDGIKTFGDGVLAMCNGLDSVKIHTGDHQDFIIENGIVYNRKKDEVISVLPNAIGQPESSQGDVPPARLCACRMLPHQEREAPPPPYSTLGVKPSTAA